MPEVLKFREVMGEYQQEIEIPINYFSTPELNQFLADFLRKMEENFHPENEPRKTKTESKDEIK